MVSGVNGDRGRLALAPVKEEAEEEIENATTLLLKVVGVTVTGCGG